MSPVRAFIVRPFGVKEGIDFGRVQQELIDGVLETHGITGSTTEVIAHAGNIRTDMFEELLLADLVIADISIDNANVYYELGVRHSLRPRTTILIRAKNTEPPTSAANAKKQSPEAKHDVPFDLRTERYLQYDPHNPGAASHKLTDAVVESLAKDTVDSPVFLLLPALPVPDLEKYRPVPAGFSEEVTRAWRSDDQPRLGLLADEAAEFAWRLAGLRLIAKAQFDLNAWPDARVTCEAIRDLRRQDPDANLKLGTVYNRLKRPVDAMAALERIKGDQLTAAQEAERRALSARNDKDLWVSEWWDLEPEGRQAVALRSPLLETARKGYDEGFLADQNHWYSGINALALLAVTLELVAREPAEWSARFATDEEAESERKRLEGERDDVVVALRRSLAAEAFRTHGQAYNVWADLTRADLQLLTSDRPLYVRSLYADARARQEAAHGGDFPAESAADQIRLYLRLGVFTDNARAALDGLGAPEERPALGPRTRIIVFSGHRMDGPAREVPRFPAGSVDTARAMIREAVLKERDLAGSGPIEGVAGGASGGDILFHEICAETEIPTTLLLAIPETDYVAASVADAGADWVERFRELVRRLDGRVKVLSDSKELPQWLAERKNYSIWQRNNRWTLHTALSRSGADITLIVLWDGRGGDGPGGTEDMVKLAESRGVKVVVLPASRLTDSEPEA